MSTLSLAATEFSGTFRVQPELQYANSESVLSSAHDLLNADANSLTTELELRAHYGSVNGVATWRHEMVEHASDGDAVLLNELFANQHLGGWYLTVGKKIMSWDVGYAFRPLDVIQQEDRRRLITTTLEGVPLLAAEKFGANSAWTLVIANPQATRDTLGRAEPAIALRGYWRVGSADLYAVARQGADTGWRAGLATAWVVNEGLELHASALRAAHLNRLSPLSTSLGVPLGYELEKGDAGWQALVGFNWANESKFAIVGEAYRDERAFTASQWRQWRDVLSTIAALPVPTRISQGLTALQASALATPSLRRDNLVTRLSRTGDHWSPSLDVLYTPADGGVIATARLNWTGNRLNAEMGWRAALGAADSIARQLPFQRVFYASFDFSF